MSSIISGLLVLIICLLLPVAVIGEEENELIVHYINVSHGNAALIQFNEKNLLIDAGPEEYAEELISYLTSHNADTIDMMVSTSSLPGYIGGIKEILGACVVRLYIDDKEQTASNRNKKIRELISAESIPHEETYAGDYLDFDDDIYVKVLSPGSDTDAPIVIQLDYDGIKFLFMSSANADLESVLVDNYYMNSQILLVGDHGAPATCSKPFLAEVQPEVALISVGSDNEEGYPSSGTCDRIRETGAELYRTDSNGTIVITTNGDEYQIVTEK
ncbi:MAG: hypothetical protein JXA44_11725 [Methanospirillaceae archaeon]|nr:hypothetical protein [Methanospirillaceae archaeon]